MKHTAVGLAVMGAVAALAGSALAQELTPAYWSKAVQSDLAERLYPGFAGLLGQGGRATLICRIEGDGHPYLCDVVEEMPKGLGFGAAARVVIASAELMAARYDGVVVSSRIQTRVIFQMDSQPFGGWTGPEPTAATLALARELIEALGDEAQWPRPYRDTMMDGLDHDRRAVVGPWLDELFPRDPAREREVMALQLARLFDEATLRRIRAGEDVTWPGEDEFFSACPDPTPAEQAAIDELRRRYCDRYSCSQEKAVTANSG